VLRECIAILQIKSFIQIGNPINEVTKCRDMIKSNNHLSNENPNHPQGYQQEKVPYTVGKGDIQQSVILSSPLLSIPCNLMAQKTTSHATKNHGTSIYKKRIAG
jgi:hypothetical protein